jgi:hypothetical protein
MDNTPIIDKVGSGSGSPWGSNGSSSSSICVSFQLCWVVAKQIATNHTVEQTHISC